MTNPRNAGEITARTKARKRAVDILFEADQKNIFFDQRALLELAQLRKTQHTAQSSPPAYSLEIVEGVANNHEVIDETLATYAMGWTLERMPAVDLAILRVAAWEILFNPEIEGPTSVDEAIKIAKQISTDDSPRFINGLLGRIVDVSPSV